MHAETTPPVPIRRSPRAAGLAAASLLLCLVVFALSSRHAAPAAEADPLSPSLAAPSTTFGAAVPNDRFVHEFQKQVEKQLQSTLEQANREQDERAQRFEQQALQLREQSDVLQRRIDEIQLRGAESGGTPAGEAPRVNVRGPRDAATPDGAALADMDAPKHRKAAEPNLSPHGFAEGRLLNGVVAVVGGPERESVVALSGRYEAANGFSTELDGCFALVQGRPELPSGRIDFKVARLTCNFPDGASKTWDVAGWLVDTDGIRGVRAQIVQNAGRKALVATAGGALSGFGRRLSQEQYQVNAGALASSSTFIGSTAHDALGGSAEGAAGALGQSISDYYNLYAPSLQVGGGTQVSLVIANELRFPPDARASTQTHTSP